MPPVAAALPLSSAGRLRRQPRSLPLFCLACHSRRIALRRWYRRQWSGASVMSRRARSTRWLAAGFATTRGGRPPLSNLWMRQGIRGLDTSIRTVVLSSPIPNAFTPPGGKVFLFKGLLERAENPDEIAGVLAHELGHLKHRDSTRNLIYNGGTSFLIGLLFGDITGSGALIFASRSLVSASYSREAEENADTFSIDVMRKLGRSPKAMGELMYRVTGKQVDKTLSILASHPLTEDRLARMSREDRPASGPPLLTAQEWRSLKSICGPKKS
jgi:hypothetical protein